MAPVLMHAPPMAERLSITATRFPALLPGWRRAGPPTGANSDPVMRPPFEMSWVANRPCCLVRQSCGDDWMLAIQTFFEISALCLTAAHPAECPEQESSQHDRCGKCEHPGHQKVAHCPPLKARVIGRHRPRHARRQHVRRTYR